METPQTTGEWAAYMGGRLLGFVIKMAVAAFWLALFLKVADVIV